MTDLPARLARLKAEHQAAQSRLHRLKPRSGARTVALVNLAKLTVDIMKLERPAKLRKSKTARDEYLARVDAEAARFGPVLAAKISVKRVKTQLAKRGPHVHAT